MNGCKRCIMVDMLGLLIHVWVSAANIQVRDGLKYMIDRIKGIFKCIKIIFADQAYSGAQNYIFLNLIRRYTLAFLYHLIYMIDSLLFVIYYFVEYLSLIIVC